MKWLRRRWIVTSILGGLFVFAAANAINESRQALEYREMRGAATELELAAHTLSMIELIEDRPPGIELERTAAVDLLDNPTVFDRTGLSATSQARAAALTSELTDNAIADMQTDRAEVSELLQILHTDAETAGAAAISAQNSAFQYIVISAISGLVIVWLVLASQNRERRLKGSLRSQAYTDFLTGLPNRRELPVRLDAARETIVASGTHAAMFYMDLDGFKDINDSGGHSMGDQILRHVAEKLSMVAQEGETLIRLGGDEFGVVLLHLDSVEQVLEAAERYRTALDGRIDLGGPHDVLNMSIGVAATDKSSELDDLQVRANLAMYEAKKCQGSAVVMFEEEFREAADATRKVQRALRTADIEQEFFLEFQPIVAIGDHDVFFVEALLRWDSPVLGRVRPDEFIPVAERNGEIVRLGSWVIQQACRQLAKWGEAPSTRDFSVSVNVSIDQLEHDSFVETLRDAAEVTGVDPAKLIIEVTESSATGPLVQERLREIQSLGHRVAIDDFGSGYSNLAQLIHTPFDILKIDRELMSSLDELSENGRQSLEVLSAVSAIARAQDAPVVCEGVEDPHQLQPLLDAGISHIQGWLISKALSPEDLPDLVASLTALPKSA